MQAAISILRDEELIRPSKWQEQPLPNRDYTNWNEVFMTFLTVRALLVVMEVVDDLDFMHG